MKPLMVVKVGGSLLEWRELPGRLREFLDSRSDHRIVLICGGGSLVDSIRRLDAIHGLGDEASHDLAIAAMNLSAEILSRLVEGVEHVVDVGSLEHCWTIGRIPVLSPRLFLDDDEHSPAPLPHDWSVTSDSIAARLADRLGAESLVLLKSASIPPESDQGAAARLGLVDPIFPKVASYIPSVRYRNLKAIGSEESELA